MNARILVALVGAGLLSLGCGSSGSNGSTPNDGTDSGPGTVADSGVDDTFDAAPEDTAPPASCPVGTDFTPVAGKIIVEVAIDDGAPQKWILDTGAPSSLLDTSITLSGADHVIHLAGHDFKVRHIEQGDVATSLQIPGVVGIFGMDLLTRAKASLTLDYPRSKLWIDDALDEPALLACDHVAGKPFVTPYKANSYFFVPGKLEDVDGWFLVDSGATLGAVPDDVFDALNAAHPRPALDGFYTPAFVGTFWARMSAIGALHVGDLAVDHIVIRTIDKGLLTPPDATTKLLGLLPSGFLHHFMITLDFSAKTVRFDAAKGDDMKEAPKYFAVGIGLEHVTDAPIHVSQVLSGSSAEEQGVLAGDEIVTVAGKDFATLAAYSRPWSLMSGTLGAKIAVTVKRSDGTHDLTLEARDLLRDP
jgi:hypothetical protein